MNRQVARCSLMLALCGLLLAACGRSAPEPTPDLQATVQAAVEATRDADNLVATAVAATLTASAPAADEAPAPTATPASVAAAPTATPTNPPAPPANTPTPTETRLVIEESAPATPTQEPTNTPPPTPTSTPTQERLVIVESVVDGNDGNDFLRGSSSSNQGRVVLLPGFGQAEVTRPMRFDGRIALRVEVFDTRVGLTDGDGIDHVTFRLVGDAGGGDVVYEKTESSAAYCLFGGDEPTCSTLVFARSGNRWPNGAPIVDGDYVAQIDIVARNGESTQWRWAFQIAGAQPRQEARPDLVANVVETGPGALDTYLTEALVFRVEAYDPAVGDWDGAGIRNVEMQIVGPDGAPVYARVENNAGYCAFSGGEPDCTIWDFAENGYYWPGGRLIRSGAHLLRARINAQDGRQAIVEMRIEIGLP
ncbi:MAG: hypothetical protein KJZ93_29170 [Caldilineaceae bacterium]|nr:hypothetical protein [Caldilineaceae bacterium]